MHKRMNVCMCIYICMCVSMYVRMYEFMYVLYIYIYVRKYISMYVFMYIYMYVSMYIYVSICMYVNLIFNTHLPILIYMSGKAEGYAATHFTVPLDLISVSGYATVNSVYSRCVYILLGCSKKKNLTKVLYMWKF